jgi:hypothetical protein
MNRALFFPAIGCALAYGGTFALLHRAAGEGGPPPAAAPQPAVEPAPVADEVRTTLEAVAADYVRPWQEYRQAAASPFSRAIVRPVPSITTTVDIAAADVALPGNLLLATIHVTLIGVSTTSTPCIIDRETKAVRLFAGGRWLTTEDWLKTAPHPRNFRAPSDTRDEATAPQPAQPTP